MLSNAAGVLVSFDLNYRAALWNEEKSGVAYRTILSKADIGFAGEDGAVTAVESSEDLMDRVRRITEPGPRQVSLKLGEVGAESLVESHDYQHDAIRIPVVDTVGAGDVFVAGHITESLNGLDTHN